MNHDVMLPAELRARRAALGMSQRDLAARLGVRQVTVSRWERGYTPVPDGIDTELRAIESAQDDAVARLTAAEVRLIPDTDPVAAARAQREGGYRARIISADVLDHARDIMARAFGTPGPAEELAYQASISARHCDGLIIDERGAAVAELRADELRRHLYLVDEWLDEETRALADPRVCEGLSADLVCGLIEDATGRRAVPVLWEAFGGAL